MVLCDDLPTAEEAYVIADRVRDAVSEPLEVSGAGTFLLTVSAGIAFAGPFDDPEAVISEADRAMYKVKRQAS